MATVGEKAKICFAYNITYYHNCIRIYFALGNKTKIQIGNYCLPTGTNSAKIFIERDPRFGADKEIDEHIQIFESVKLRDSIIHKYDLVTHYNIDTAGPTKAYQLHAEYNDNIKIDRTRYNSIMVTVYDTDPVLAAAIANDIITIGDKVKNEIIHTNLMQIFYSIEREFKLKSNALDEMALKVNAATKSTIAEGAKIATLNTTDIIRQQANIQSYIKVYTEQQKMTSRDYCSNILI
ncbi:MAG: hypothetical protein IPP29_02085 [Bacteroidetes bacterium]|nr:hypothetical protein [Bacteroidota bacterium]